MGKHSDHCNCTCDKLEAVLIQRMNEAEMSRQSMEVRGFPESAEFWQDVRNIMRAALEDASLYRTYEMSENCTRCEILGMVCLDCYISQGGFDVRL